MGPLLPIIDQGNLQMPVFIWAEKYFAQDFSYGLGERDGGYFLLLSPFQLIKLIH